jgi:hypothetical protein
MGSVSLTTFSGFKTANIEGECYFDENQACYMDPRRTGTHGGFETLIDIVSSRKFVTPIPIADGR